MDDQMDRGGDREEALPEHETRPEGREGGGLSQLGISAEQRGPVDHDVLEAQDEDGDELAIDSDEPPPAYRQFSG
jgi:hypothetical protein